MSEIDGLEDGVAEAVAGDDDERFELYSVQSVLGCKKQGI